MGVAGLSGLTDEVATCCYASNSSPGGLETRGPDPDSRCPGLNRIAGQTVAQVLSGAQVTVGRCFEQDNMS